MYLSAQTEESSRTEIPPGVRPWRGAAGFRQCLQRLVGGQHAVNGKAVEYALHLRQLLDRSEGLERFVVAAVVFIPAARRLFLFNARHVVVRVVMVWVFDGGGGVGAVGGAGDGRSTRTKTMNDLVR